MSRAVLTSIDQEYRRYKGLGDGAIEQIPEAALGKASGIGNSLATVVWHVSGNLKSRFTDFLTTDGEKAWRQREEEFAPRDVPRAEVRKTWDEGWAVLLETLASLTDDDLLREVTIRERALPVHEALHRSLAHTAYHVGQMVHIAKVHAGEAWEYLSIAPGGTAAYNANPDREQGSR